MRISSSFNNYNNISNFFNTLAQGQTSLFAAKLSSSKFLFPENTAPGKGSVSSDTVSYISDIKSAAGDLSDALKSLSGGAFNKNAMISSNTEALTVNYSGSSAGLNSMGETKVKIDQIAKGQVNEGSALKSANSYSGNTGTNKFAIEMNGKTTQLSVSVSAVDTNKDVQLKMANAINNAGLGLKATVETDKDTGTSTLRVENQTTGSDAKNAFSIKDVSGNAVEKTGAGTMKSAGQDAIYSINGGAAQTSKTNTINLGNGLTATLKAASDSEVTIARGKDSQAAIGAVKDMVSSYNKLFSSAAGNVGDPKAQNLASRMLNVSSVYSKSLSDIGISFGNDGKMVIDSDKLNKAAENGSLEKFFTENSGKNYGFTNTLGRLADNVKSNTASFVTNSLLSNSLNNGINYSGLGNTTQINALGVGSLFDYSF